MTERGTVTLWMLGLGICVLFLGGLSLDLWRGVAARRELSAQADTAATAGANGLDEPALRAGVVELDPDRARALAVDALQRDEQFSTLDFAAVTVVEDEVVVTLQDRVPMSLLGIFDRGNSFVVRVTARARPEIRP
ncbi:MAG: pilus assembly protein TadG-related protein [Actinomycetota bacterium]